MNRTAAITGATGFIGWNLCEYLRDEGWSVRALVRPGSSKPTPTGVERLVVPLKRDELAQSLESSEVVFHLAALTRAPNYSAYARINAQATHEVGLAARSTATRLVYVSSQGRPGGPGTTTEAPRREQDPPAPVSAYGASKLAGEKALQQIDGLRAVVVRPSAVYGPRDKDFLILFQLASWGLFPVIGDPRTSYTLIHVRDLVRGLEIAGRSREALGRAFFLGHREAVTSEDILRAIAGAVGRSHRPFRIPRSLLWSLCSLGNLCSVVGRTGALNRSRYKELTADGFVCCVEESETTLGFAARIPLVEGIAETAAWYREHGRVRPAP